MRRLHGVADSTDTHVSELQELVKDREAWRAAGYGVAKTRTRLSHGTKAAQRHFGGSWDP